jgi:hypothetical protein
MKKSNPSSASICVICGQMPFLLPVVSQSFCQYSAKSLHYATHPQRWFLAQLPPSCGKGRRAAALHNGGLCRLFRIFAKTQRNLFAINNLQLKSSISN